ncbi:hypothetical protein SAMN05216387_1253 [Nitrosovibrio tenuis]|uniref:Uncharacterized protein n=2 Tax=Nitrosovibrio tenuis TaxID=1233 RepID=A0A1H7S106_9PROT|nr:hypothetical protein SAMN05216387_1253 [Nitrosovibrio tenuis]
MVILGALFVGFGGTVGYAQEALLSAKKDYITCWKQPCVLVAGSEWSEKNPNGIGISVRMGTQSGVTDDQIKTVLTRDFKKVGMTNIKFFFEQSDAPAAGISFHVRGGTTELFLIDNVREQVATIAKRAANTNPLFQ